MGVGNANSFNVVSVCAKNTPASLHLEKTLLRRSRPQCPAACRRGSWVVLRTAAFWTGRQSTLRTLHGGRGKQPCNHQPHLQHRLHTKSTILSRWGTGLRLLSWYHGSSLRGLLPWTMRPRLQRILHWFTRVLEGSSGGRRRSSKSPSGLWSPQPPWQLVFWEPSLEVAASQVLSF